MSDLMTSTTTGGQAGVADLRDILNQGYVDYPAGLDEEKFIANRHPPMFLVYSVFLRYFKNVYHMFDGDLVLALVLAEIWMFNMARYFNRTGLRQGADVLSDPEKRRTLLPGCNAYAVSQTLGVPSETVRRKVRKLEQMGWLERNHDGALIVTLKLEELFPPALTLQDIRYFVGTARMLTTLLEDE